MKKTSIKNFYCTIILLIAIIFSTLLCTSYNTTFADYANEDYDIYEERADGDSDPRFSSIDVAEPAVANTSNPPTYKTYREAYFSGLTQNMGVNCKNTCGYVALGMLLSYYDSFLNDDIIPENYDVVSTGKETNMVERNNSPGIMRDEVGGNSKSPMEYFRIMESIQEISFHSKLLMIGKKLGKLNVYDDKNFGSTINEDRVEILSAYFKERGITHYSIISAVAKDTEISFTDRDNHVKDFVKYYIDLGYPVVLGAVKSSSSKKGHTMICYAYNGDHF